jgi:Arc/MetJ-type ribon-helix-helix transcriptional regulator
VGFAWVVLGLSMGKKAKLIEVQIPAEDNKEIENFVNEGEFASRQEFMTWAVKRYFAEMEETE